MIDSRRIANTRMDLDGIGTFDVPELDRRLDDAVRLLAELNLSYGDLLDAITNGFEHAAYDLMERALVAARPIEQVAA